MTTTRTATARTASPRQAENIEKFRTRKVLSAVAIDLLNTYDLDPTARNAGRVLDYLFDASTPWLPTPRTATTPAITEPGLYVTTDGQTVYRVKVSANTGNLYACRLDTTQGIPAADRWIYEGQAPLRTVNLTPLTKDLATTYGHTTGICARCGADLSNPESVARGLGPVCATKF